MSDRLLYVDSSALVKLVIDEPESAALERHLTAGPPLLATSRIAVVEVMRATRLANPAPEVREECERLLAACLLIGLTNDLIGAAARLASRSVRTLDAIHLASALKIEPTELVAYDRHLIAAAAEHGLTAATPGATPPAP